MYRKRGNRENGVERVRRGERVCVSAWKKRWKRESEKKSVCVEEERKLSEGERGGESVQL